MAHNFKKVWIQKKASVLALNAGVIDSVLISNFSKIDYKITVKRNNKILSFNVLLINSDSELSWQIYSVIGKININLDFISVLGRADLNLVNNEAEGLAVTFERLITNI